MSGMLMLRRGSAFAGPGAVGAVNAASIASWSWSVSSSSGSSVEDRRLLRLGRLALGRRTRGRALSRADRVLLRADRGRVERRAQEPFAIRPQRALLGRRQHRRRLREVWLEQDQLAQAVDDSGRVEATALIQEARSEIGDRHAMHVQITKLRQQPLGGVNLCSVEPLFDFKQARVIERTRTHQRISPSLSSR